jgi:NTE family protein
MIKADKIFTRMRSLLGGARIEDLPIPFTAVATDLLAGKAVWFQTGPVETAVRASIAMPGVFTPVILNGRLLVDGGLLDPVPVAPTASARADVIIAIDLGGEHATPHGGAPARETAEPRPVEEWADRFHRATADLFDRDRVHALLSRLDAGSSTNHDGQGMDSVAEVHDDWPAGLTPFDVMNQSLEVMQSVVTRYRLAGNHPDVLITIPKDACRTLDFHRASEMIALGRELTIAALDASTVLA